MRMIKEMRLGDMLGGCGLVFAGQPICLSDEAEALIRVAKIVIARTPSDPPGVGVVLHGKDNLRLFGQVRSLVITVDGNSPSERIRAAMNEDLIRRLRTAVRRVTARSSSSSKKTTTSIVSRTTKEN